MQASSETDWRVIKALCYAWFYNFQVAVNVAYKILQICVAALQANKN